MRVVRRAAGSESVRRDALRPTTTRARERAREPGARDLVRREARVAGRGATARASVAQLNGRLDRLQFAGVDGVVTADIENEEERSLCRDARKALNRDVERVRERIQGLHVELNKVCLLYTSPSPRDRG